MSNFDKLSLHFFPEEKEILRTDCENIDPGNLEEYQDLIDGMIKVVEEVNGLGVSAPQVGVTKNISVISRPREPLILVNPEITDRNGQMTSEEGCLSFPGLYAEIDRAGSIEYEALDRNGEEVSDKVHGKLATIIQHEIDHLNGTLFVDHLSPVMHRMKMKDYKKMRKKSARKEMPS